MIKEYLPYLVPVLCALIGAYSVRQTRENKKLRDKYRRCLADCLAFYKIEERMAAQIAKPGPLPLGSSTPLAVKRFFRLILRSEGTPTPSDRATPHQIMKEISDL
jgi:hypothetical protein